MHPLVHPKNEWKKFGYIKTNMNGEEIMKHSGGGVGCWLSFTPELIKKIGYFKVMEGKYGYEHINFTHRCIYHNMIPHGCDIVDPFSYMDHIGFEPVGYNKFNNGNEVRIYGSIKNNKVFIVKLTRELMLLINERSLENSEGLFYYHRSNIRTNIGVVGSFLKIDVLVDFDLNIPQLNEFDEESFINISEFDKKEILNPDEELAWPIIKGMILAEL